MQLEEIQKVSTIQLHLLDMLKVSLLRDILEHNINPFLIPRGTVTEPGQMCTAHFIDFIRCEVFNLIINGKDELSQVILQEFEGNSSLADIAKKYRLSMDQVKRLKRYYNYCLEIKTWGTTDILERFEWLGLKGLLLRKYLINQNLAALTEILTQIIPTTTREELKAFINRYELKQQRIVQFEQQYKQHREELIKTHIEYENQLKKLNNEQENIRKKFKWVEAYPEKIRSLLQKYIGPYRNGYALRKRLDSGLRKALEQKGILSMNTEYIWEIHSIERFAEQLEYRLARNYYISWDYEREYKRNPLYAVEDENYVAVRSYVEELDKIEEDIASIVGEMKQLETEAELQRQKFEQIKQASILTIEEAGIASNMISERELLRHRELEVIVMKWLYAQGFVVANEVTLPNKRRVDVIAYKEGCIVIVEVKASEADYSRDNKWKEYLPYCDIFYFCMDQVAYKRDSVGYLRPYKHSVEVLQEDTYNHLCENKLDIEYLINRTLSQRLIY